MTGLASLTLVVYALVHSTQASALATLCLAVVSGSAFAFARHRPASHPE